MMLIYRGGIPRPIGDFLETLSQAMLLGTMLAGRLGVVHKHKYTSNNKRQHKENGGRGRCTAPWGAKIVPLSSKQLYTRKLNLKQHRDISTNLTNNDGPVLTLPARAQDKQASKQRNDTQHELIDKYTTRKQQQTLPARAQDNIAPFSTEEARRMVEEELGPIAAPSAAPSL